MTLDNRQEKMNKAKNEAVRNLWNTETYLASLVERHEEKALIFRDCGGQTSDIHGYIRHVPSQGKKAK